MDVIECVTLEENMCSVGKVISNSSNSADKITSGAKVSLNELFQNKVPFLSRFQDFDGLLPSGTL